MRHSRLRWALLAGVLATSTPAHGQPAVLAAQALTTAGADCTTPTSCAVLPEVSLSGVPSLGVYVDVGTSGTFNFEATLDGVTWFAVTDDVNAASSVTSDAARFFSNPGYRSFRVRASAISGTATISYIRGTAGLRSTASLSGGGGDGAIQDGSNASLEATVFDLTNANPLATQIVDANGDAITSFGGGTQYTEDAAAVANPVGTALNLIRADSLGAVASADGDNLAARGTNNGELYVADVTARTSLATLAGAVAGTEVQVDVATLPALPAGTNNIGDVDVLTLPALPTGSNTIGAVNLAQYTPASGRLPVDGSGVTQPVSAASLPLPSGAATLAEQQTQTTALQALDNIVSGSGANISQIGGAAPDPCLSGAKVFVAISQTTSTQLLTGTASNRTYVCGLLVTQAEASTQTFSLVSGTGSTCATSTAAMIGATSAANGMPLPFSIGGANASVAKSAVDADNVCLLQSGSDRIAGVLSYVVAP